MVSQNVNSQSATSRAWLCVGGRETGGIEEGVEAGRREGD